jgi:hypothetical protein
MNTLRRSLRSTSAGIALVVALAAVLVPATAAYAGSAFAGTAYDGTSLHGRYTVDLTPGCPCFNDQHQEVPPSSLSVDLYTHPKPGSGCKATGYEFDPATISPDGSFSATGSFSSTSPQLTFTVQGTFLSLDSVHGTITGNYGCGTDSFTINLRPAPLILTAPCVMLTEVHAPMTITGGLAVSSANGTFDAAGGTCDLSFGPYSDAGFTGGQLWFIVGDTAGAADYMTEIGGSGEGVAASWQHQKPVAGLGPGAPVYYDSEIFDGKLTTSIGRFEVEFHRSGVWASLYNTPSAAENQHSCGCFSPAGFAIREGHVVKAAKALRSLL